MIAAGFTLGRRYYRHLTLERFLERARVRSGMRAFAWLEGM